MSRKPRPAVLRRPLALWLAVLIAVFAALAPTLSHALAWSQSGGAPMVEVCTSTGMRWVAENAAADSLDGQESAAPQNHCPFCLLSTDRVGPVSHALVHLFAVMGEPEAATIRQAFYFVTHFALTPPPRGPPVFS
jgi:hypothetical protein